MTSSDPLEHRQLMGQLQRRGQNAKRQSSDGHRAGNSAGV
jgi:hypothetical protein